MCKYLTFFFALFSYTLSSQSIFNTELIKEIESSSLYKKLQVMVLVKSDTEINFSQFPGIELQYKAGNMYAITGDIKSIKQLAAKKSIIRIEYVKHKLQVMADTCVVRNRIKNIKLGISPLSQPYDGTGVIIGIIDTGTDFSHPDFKDANGNSRIKFLWDMTKPHAANTPAIFGYGQEWTNTEIDLGQCTHSDVAHFGHGTNTTGIAAGNGLAINHFEGMAPKADIIVVALDFARPGYTIADAIQYIATKAQLLNKPLVINASVGDYMGSHDGTDLESQMINNLIANIPGRALVAAVGNGGSTPFHVGYNVNSIDTNFTWVRNSNLQTEVREYSDTNDIKNVQYSIGVDNGSFTNLGNLPFKSYKYALDTLRSDTIYHNAKRIGIIERIASINSFGVYELEITIRADSLNYLWRIEHTGAGRIDSWNFDYMTSGLPSPVMYPRIWKYKKADTLQSIVSGFQCSDEVIAVGNYVNRNQYQDVNNVTQITSETPGNIASSSSTGPTRDNRVKPDITASGATILTCAATAMLPNLIANSPQVVALGGFHVTAGGTSASSPVVAGMAALYLQKNPTATNQQIKQAIINCAYGDIFTTHILPNYQWGYGKLDGFKAMTCGSSITNINVINNQTRVSVFPNPSTKETTVFFENDEPKKIKLYNAAGQQVFSDECRSASYLLKLNNLPAGLYLLHSEEKNATGKVKIIIL